MKKNIPILIIASLILLCFSCNNENSSNKAAEKENAQKFDSTDIKRDVNFAMEAGSGGLMEVELGNWAVTNGTSPEVKEFGQNMVSDHTGANEELKALAQSKNITLPDVPDNNKQKKIDALKKKTGAEFDKAYIDLMVDDHKKDIEAFQKEADKGNDTEIKAWANGKIATLQHHLQMAQSIQDKLKNAK